MGSLLKAEGITDYRRFEELNNLRAGLRYTGASKSVWKRSRRSPGFGVKLVEPWLQIPQCLIGHGTQRTQRMVLRNSLLRADIAEDIQLLFVFSTHALFLSPYAVETREYFGTGLAFDKTRVPVGVRTSAPGM